MISFDVGQKIIHPEHGAAVVRFVGKKRIGLEFADGRQGLFRKKDLCPPPAQTHHQPTKEKTCLPWPESTFVQENADVQHYLGAHWAPFIDDVKVVFEKLPEFLKEAVVKNALGLILKPERTLPEEWTQGATLAWPSSQEGIAITVHIAVNSNEIVNLFPFTQHGSQHRLYVEKVIVWEDGLTAQIDTLFGDASLTFFDTDFVANRGWYEAGCVQEFLLTGIAYSAQPAEIFELPITHSSDVVAWRNQLAEQNRNKTIQETEMLSLKGMALLFPLREGDVDEYSFRGEVVLVQPFSGFIGQKGWRARVRVMRDAPDSLDLDICITEKAWQGKESPQLGEDIEGALWLQGHLWSTRSINADEP